MDLKEWMFYVNRLKRKKLGMGEVVHPPKYRIKVYKGVTNITMKSKVKSILKLQGQYEQTPIALNPTIDETIGFGVMGKTYQNLWTIRKGSANLNNVSNITTTHYKGNIKAGSDCGFTMDCSLVRPSTYTFMFQIKVDSLASVRGKIMFFDYGTLVAPESVTSTVVLKEGWNTVILSRATTKKGATILVGVNAPAEAIDAAMEVKDIVILEGNYIDDPNTPSYFRGIIGVGDEQVDGNYKIPVTSIGINLVNLNEIKSNEKVDVTIEGNKITATSKAEDTFSSASYKIDLSSFKGKMLTLSADNFVQNGMIGSIIQINVRKTDGTYSYFGIRDTFKINKFKVPLDYFDSSIAIYSNNTNTPAMFTTSCENVMLEVGEVLVPSPYEPFKSNTTTITLTEPLMQLPTGTADEMQESGVPIRRVGKVLLNGSESYVLDSYVFPTATTITFVTFVTDMIRANVESLYLNLICDSFPVTRESIASEVEGISSHTDTNKGGYLRMTIFKSRLVTEDVSGFKKWLSENPVTVYYQLLDAQPMPAELLNVSHETFGAAPAKVNPRVEADKAKQKEMQQKKDKPRQRRR